MHGVRIIRHRYGRGITLVLLAAWLAGGQAQGDPELDYGDADADNYPVLASQDAARHVIVPTVYLGAVVDADADGQPTPDAVGDDVDADGDDEDGVVPDSLFSPGMPARLAVTASTNGYLQGWFDFGLAGWSFPGSQALVNVPVTAGVQVVALSVPESASPGLLNARLRFSTQPDLGVSGEASDGEVEDYQWRVLNADFGDAPEGESGPYYPTRLRHGGAYHEITAPLYLGEAVDSEADGEPAPGADADAGDDGVQWVTPLVVGQEARIEVSVSMPGALNLWIDYDGDGTWAQEDNHVLYGIGLPAGVSQLSFTVPVSASATQTYARVRFATESNLAADGPAADGEVEDYAVTIEHYDFGDAGEVPGQYQTLLGFNGARHLVVPHVRLGDLLDGEPDATQTQGARGDDDRGLDDEDGVSVLGPVFAGAFMTVSVNVATSGLLQAWVDFARNFDWSDPGEQVARDVALAPGATPLTFAVPTNAASGATYARFRFSTVPGLDSYGAAPDGEVEDHEVVVASAALDWGDAPAGGSYPVLRSATGATHRLVEGICLGGAVNGDEDGQPSDTATGDDDDGVVFSNGWIAGLGGPCTVSASVAGYLQAWFDFNADGDWDDANEQVFQDRFIGSGLTDLPVNIPLSVTATALVARFRFSTGPGVGVGGFADDGEVEDYLVPLSAADCGDAPDTDGYRYVTRIEAGGPFHLIDGELRLGAARDAEPNGQPTPLANGDGSDDDGVVWLGPAIPGADTALRVTASSAAYLQAWVDVARDGDWNASSDRVFENQPLFAGANLLTWRVPADAGLGTTFARFRLSSQAGVAAGGRAPDGEVEDYAVGFTNPPPPATNLPADACDVWLQRPNRDYGIDVQSWYQPSFGPTNGRVVRAVDDWIGEGRRVTGLRWWGSYINWTNNPAAVPAASRPYGFLLTLYADGLTTNTPLIPTPGLEVTNVSVALLPYNAFNAQPGQVTERLLATSRQGAFSTPGDFEYEYEYTLLLTNAWPVARGHRYWVSVEALVASTPTYRWGWCVAYPADGMGVAAQLRKSNERSWTSMTYPPNVFPWTSATNHPDRGRPVELAFELFSDACPRRAHQWPQWADSVIPDGVPAWIRAGGGDYGYMRADDLVSDGRSVGTIVWEGAYAGWATAQRGSMTNPVAPPTGTGHPLGFLLSWRTTNGAECAPGPVVRELFVPSHHCGEQFLATREQPWAGTRMQVYSYQVDLLDPRVGGGSWTGEPGATYWFGVQAVFSGTFAVGTYGHDGWIWHNALALSGCGSVSSILGDGFWSGTVLAPPHPMAGNPVDLAFDLLSSDVAPSPLYNVPEFLSPGVTTNGNFDFTTLGDLGAGMQVLQVSTNLVRGGWADVVTNRLPRDIPYTNRWPDVRPPPGGRSYWRVLQR